MFQLLTKINTLKLQIFFMKKANMKMHYSFISCCHLHLDQMRCSHWDFEDKDGQKSVLYYANKKNQRKKFSISEELYVQVMNFKEMKVNNGTYQIRSFTTPTGKTITGHFVFDLTRSKLQKKISRKFAKLIPDMKSRPKDIRMSSISNEFREHGIQRASSLGLHTSVNQLKNITQELQRILNKESIERSMTNPNWF